MIYSCQLGASNQRNNIRPIYECLFYLNAWRKETKKRGFGWCDFPVFCGWCFLCFIINLNIHAKRGNITERIPEARNWLLGWVGLWVIRVSKNYLLHTALPLTLGGAGAAPKWGEGCGFPLQHSDSPTTREIFGPSLRRVLTVNNSHTELFGTGTLECV